MQNVASVTTKSKPAQLILAGLKNKNGKVKAMFVNSENANAYTGKVGYGNVIKIAKSLAKINNCEKENIIISSTGVIGEQLPIDSIIKKTISVNKQKNIRKTKLVIFCKSNNDYRYVSKSSIQADIHKQKYNIVGISKGSGMIAPNMATMLGFIFTDAQITSKQLQQLLKGS